MSVAKKWKKNRKFQFLFEFKTGILRITETNIRFYNNDKTMTESSKLGEIAGVERFKDTLVVLTSDGVYKFKITSDGDLEID